MWLNKKDENRKHKYVRQESGYKAIALKRSCVAI
jgi:hypothetical protein